MLAAMVPPPNTVADGSGSNDSLKNSGCQSVPDVAVCLNFVLDWEI